MSLVMRTFLLVAIVLGFSIAVEAHHERDLRRARAAELDDEALRLAEVAALDLDRIIEGTRQLVSVLAQLDPVRKRDGPACNRLFAQLKPHYPMYVELAVADTAGRIICSSDAAGATADALMPAPSGKPVEVAGLFIGGFAHAVTAAAPVLSVSALVVDEGGRGIGTLYVGLSLDWLQAALAARHLPEAAMVEVADAHGVLLARHPGPRGIGRPIAAAMEPLLTADRPGTAELVDDSGVTRIYGYVPAGLDPGKGFFVGVGLNKTLAWAATDRAGLTTLVLLAAVLAATGLVAWVYLRRVIKRPTDSLLDAARRWTAGDWSARAAVTKGPSEIARLGAAFDAMANAVGERAQRLRQNQEHLARAQRMAAIGSGEFDFRTGRFHWSDQTYRIYGLDKTSAAPDAGTLARLVHPEDRSRVAESHKLLKAGITPPPIEYRIIRADGEVRTIFRASEPLIDEAGQVIGGFAVVRDITEQRAVEHKRHELEAQLRHGQKLEALGRLAGGIAHDLNNTLVPVLALSKFALMSVPPSAPAHEQLEIIHAAGRRARDLVSQILAFSRKGASRREPVRLQALLCESLKLLRPSLSPMIAFETRVGEVPAIFGDASQLHQVIVNLITNAAQAIGEAKGVIAIVLEEDCAESLPGLGVGTVKLSIGDTGCGMDEATLARIFDPFFTTKGVNDGTGLGLSVVHGIVASHGGRVAVESRLREGSCFTIVLPVVAEEATAGTAADAARREPIPSPAG